MVYGTSFPNAQNATQFALKSKAGSISILQKKNLSMEEFRNLAKAACLGGCKVYIYAYIYFMDLTGKC